MCVCVCVCVCDWWGGGGEGGGGWVHAPLFEFPLVLQNQNLNFLCSLLPEITFFLMFP